MHEVFNAAVGVVLSSPTDIIDETQNRSSWGLSQSDIQRNTTTRTQSWR
jgi:hypothetical protein